MVHLIYSFNCQLDWHNTLLLSFNSRVLSLVLFLFFPPPGIGKLWFLSRFLHYVPRDLSISLITPPPKRINVCLFFYHFTDFTSLLYFLLLLWFSCMLFLASYGRILIYFTPFCLLFLSSAQFSIVFALLIFIYLFFLHASL